MIRLHVLAPSEKFEVGQQIKCNGRDFWVSKVSETTIDLIPDPDEIQPSSKAIGFWRTLLALVLFFLCLKLLF
jgi:hypothetical protein